jgi:aspartate/methionine/tyrosine aminotransferase
MKMAWVISSGPVILKRQAMERLEVIADSYLSPNAPVQLATPVFLAQRHGFQKQVMARIRKNLEDLDRQLALQKSCTRLEVEGGWYAVLRVPAIGSDEELAIELVTKQDVYVHPGHFFDFATEGYLVLSLIAQEEEFAEGIRRVLSAV